MDSDTDDKNILDNWVEIHKIIGLALSLVSPMILSLFSDAGKDKFALHFDIFFIGLVAVINLLIFAFESSIANYIREHKNRDLILGIILGVPIVYLAWELISNAMHGDTDVLTAPLFYPSILLVILGIINIVLTIKKK